MGLETEILPTNSKILNDNLLGHYTNLLDGKPVQQTPESDVYYDGISPPSLLILDVSSTAHLSAYTKVTQVFISSSWLIPWV